MLNEVERQSAVWKKLKEHYEARLATLRAKNDNAMTYEETLTLRGRIAECKAILNLDKPAEIFAE